MSAPTSRAGLLRRMTLRTRIAAVASLAVALSVLVAAVAVYFVVRADLRGQLDGSLRQRAGAFTGPGAGSGPSAGGGRGADGGAGVAPPPVNGGGGGHGFPNTLQPPPFGAASGYVQFVAPGGSVFVPGGQGSSRRIPLDAGDRGIAAAGRGSAFSDRTVAGTRLRVLTLGVGARGAVMVALPLTEIDRELGRLELLLAAIGATGILLAAGLGVLVARTALAPIARFTRSAELVTGSAGWDAGGGGRGARGAGWSAGGAGRGVDGAGSGVDGAGSGAGGAGSGAGGAGSGAGGAEPGVGGAGPASGRLDLARRLEVAGGDELARLAVSFNAALDALERSVDAQRQLVADASHELRTPIASLRANIQVLEHAERLSPQERESLRRDVIGELDELTALISDVVELARGAERELAHDELRLDDVVRAAAGRAQRRGEVRYALRLEPTVIVGDAPAIDRAVSNLLENARKWSPPAGDVEVALGGGELTVRDHGPGFREADLPFVFDRFYRAADARELPGSGLGLAIVRQAAEAHGGYARAENAPGGGALLRVGFGAPPADAVPAGLSRRAPLSSPPPSRCG